MKTIYLTLCLLSLTVFGFSQKIKGKTSDTTFHQHQITLTYPKDTTWKIGIIKLDKYNSGLSSDTTYIKKVDHVRVTLFPTPRTHVAISVSRNEFKLYSDFDSYITWIIKKSEDLTTLDTSVFYHKGLKAFEIIWRWKDTGSRFYSFQRNWFILNDGFISIINFECDESTYRKYFKIAIKIMKSVILE